jgi:hypothetical protein
MEKVCLCCNGMDQGEPRCPVCHRTMTDGGKAEDYQGPYAPYALSASDHSAWSCTHLFYCAQCQAISYVVLSLKTI